MTAALADTDLPLLKILSDPEHAIHLKKLRQRLAFRWSNASIISAFQQWAHTVSAEKQRTAAMAAGERAAAAGSWTSGWTKVDWTRVNLGSFWLRGRNDA
jgi:hypothetical protein